MEHHVHHPTPWVRALIGSVGVMVGLYILFNPSLSAGKDLAIGFVCLMIGALTLFSVACDQLDEPRN